MKERIVKIIAALVLVLDIWYFTILTKNDIIGICICGLIGFACLILIGAGFVIITDEDEEETR